MKKLTFIVFGLVLIALGYFWLNTARAAQVNPVPRTHVRGFGALTFGEIQNIHPVPIALDEERIVFLLRSRNGVHPRTHVRGLLWYGVKDPKSYTSTSVPAPKPGEKKVILKNLGMACPFCKAAITAKLKQTPGVIAYDVDLKTDSATVLYDPAKVTLEKLKQAIAEAGFQVRAVEEIER